MNPWINTVSIHTECTWLDDALSTYTSPSRILKVQFFLPWCWWNSPAHTLPVKHIRQTAEIGPQCIPLKKEISPILPKSVQLVFPRFFTFYLFFVGVHKSTHPMRPGRNVPAHTVCGASSTRTYTSSTVIMMDCRRLWLVITSWANKGNVLPQKCKTSPNQIIGVCANSTPDLPFDRFSAH